MTGRETPQARPSACLDLTNTSGTFLSSHNRGEVEKDFEGLGIGGKDDKLRLATVQGLGGFVGSFAHLLVVGSLLDQVKDFTVKEHYWSFQKSMN